MKLFPSRSPRKESFSEAFSRELEVLLRVAKRLTLHDADAEDLVSQAMVLAHRGWDSFDGRHPRSWFIAVLRNEWNNTVRKRAVRKESPLESAREPSDDRFWCAIDERLELEMIHAAIDDLPEDYRLAITLCDVEEMPHADVALALDLPVNTLRTRLFRGRKLLRSRLIEMIDPATQ